MKLDSILKWCPERISDSRTERKGCCWCFRSHPEGQSVVSWRTNKQHAANKFLWLHHGRVECPPNPHSDWQLLWKWRSVWNWWSWAAREKLRPSPPTADLCDWKQTDSDSQFCELTQHRATLTISELLADVIMIQM